MSDGEAWESKPARLIPATGIRGAKEQEERATSALLASMQVVPSFGKAVLKYVGAPAGRISCFTEPSFETDEGGTARPDGLIVVQRGKTHWVCLVEVKTGKATLDSEQVNRYVQIANREHFAALLTVSNEIVSGDNESPVKVDRRRLRGLRVGHASWFRIMTEAVTESEHHGIDDPEQAFILNDLIAYLDDPRSGAGGFEGMGGEWVGVRKAARQGTLRPTDLGVREVAEDWEQFVEYMGLHLRQRLGNEVSPSYPRASTRDSRLGEYAQSLGDDGKLSATIRVPDAVGPIEVEADLAAKLVTTSSRVAAPKEGRAKTRVNWLLRQLKDVPSDLRITVHFPRTRATSSLMIDAARKRPQDLLLPDDPRKEPQSFGLALSRDMGDKRGKGRGSFVAETLDEVVDFYGEVLQKVRKWTPPPPKLQADKHTEARDESPEPAAPDSQSEAWSWGEGGRRTDEGVL